MTVYRVDGVNSISLDIDSIKNDSYTYILCSCAYLRNGIFHAVLSHPILLCKCFVIFDFTSIALGRPSRCRDYVIRSTCASRITSKFHSKIWSAWARARAWRASQDEITSITLSEIKYFLNTFIFRHSRRRRRYIITWYAQSRVSWTPSLNRCFSFSFGNITLWSAINYGKSLVPTDIRGNPFRTFGPAITIAESRCFLMVDFP